MADRLTRSGDYAALLTALEEQLESPVRSLAQAAAIVANATLQLSKSFGRLKGLSGGAADDEIGDAASACVQALQFEDIVRQILQAVTLDLQSLAAVIAAVRDAAAGDTALELAPLAASLLSERQENAAHRPRQQTVTAGEVELF
jgi:hypothetical protein